MRHVMIFAAVVLASGCESSSTPGFCSPVGFVTCSGNDLVTCTADPDADGGGRSIRRDCTADGLVCVGGGATDGACGEASVGGRCMVQNYLTCGGGEVLRCVFVSEQPEPGLSGDIGVWRVQTACSESGQTCSNLGGGAACVSP